MPSAIANLRRIEGLFQTIVEEDDFVKKASKRTDVYDRMKNRDAHVAACWASRTYPVACAPFRVVSDAENQATALQEQLEAWRRWPDYNLTILDAIFRGWSAWELVYAPPGEFPLVLEHVSIDQDYVTFTPDGDPRLITQDHPYEGIPMPFPKFGTATWGDAHHGGRRGKAVGQRVFWPWFMKTKGLKFWASAVEKFAAPGLKAKTSKGDLDAAKARLKEILRDYVQGTGIVYEEGEEVDVIAQITRLGDSHKLFEDFCNSEISKAILGQTLTTEQGERGSYSLGKVHSGVRDDIMWADALWLADVHNGFTLPALGSLLFGGSYKRAKLEFVWEDPEEVKANTERMKIVSEIGIPLRSEDVYRSIGFPEPEPGDKVHEWKKPEPPPIPGAGLPPGAPPKEDEEEDEKDEFAEGAESRLRRAKKAQEDLDDLSLAATVKAVQDFRASGLELFANRVKKKS